MLRPADEATLAELKLAYAVVQDADGFVSVTIEGFSLPAGLEPRVTTLLIRLPPGFPDAAPDMFFLDPPVRNASGTTVAGTEAQWSDSRGRAWQRWSRHIQGQWRPGVDNFATYLAYVHRCFDLASGRAA